MDNRVKAFTGIAVMTLLSLGLGYVIATAVLQFRDYGINAQLDFYWLVQNFFALREFRPEDFRLVNMIIGGFGLAGLLLSAVLSGNALTKFGTTQWQTKSQMRKNGFFNEPGAGFVLGKAGRPWGWGKLMSSAVFPHALIVAATGRGKTSGFVIPSLLTYKGSTVTLDVKGEIFDYTSRHRAATGDEVYRFAPADWDEAPSHRYNPLLRISRMNNPDRQQMELQLIATLFLQSENDKVQGLLEGGIELFVAAGLLAFERGKPTLGEIYRISASGGNKQLEYMERRNEVTNPAAKLIFERLASTNNDTLTSYVSLLMTSGLKLWANGKIDRATEVSDFDFRDIRKRPMSVYFQVSINMVKPLAPLIRLFFSDLISSLQDKEPDREEPWPVMIFLDEFQQLGKMPVVTDSIATLRSFNAHLAIVVQSIPSIDEIYGENTRLALEGNAGIKLYFTPSEKNTVKELSDAVGKTTRNVVTQSRSIVRNPFAGRSTSERTEEAPLLPEDKARRLSLDNIILIVDGQMPIKQRRIKWFEDRYFKGIHAKSAKDKLPFYVPPKPEPEPMLAITKQRLIGKSDTSETDPAEPAASTESSHPASGNDQTAQGQKASVEGEAVPSSKDVMASSRVKKSAHAVQRATKAISNEEHGLDRGQRNPADLRAPEDLSDKHLGVLKGAANAGASLENMMSEGSGGVSVSASHT